MVLKGNGTEKGVVRGRVHEGRCRLCPAEVFLKNREQKNQHFKLTHTLRKRVPTAFKDVCVANLFWNTRRSLEANVS